jgi:putative ABC transport system permease protein
MSFLQANHPPHHLVVRAEVEPAALVRPSAIVRGLIRPARARGLAQPASCPRLGGPRFAARVFSAFALVALLLAALGLYGLLAYVVGRRTREIGVRVALGALPRDVRRLVLKEGLALTAGGILLGLAGSFGASRLLSSLLFGVGPVDPLTFGAGPLLLAAVAVAACLLPARRATRVDPAVALRSE